MQDVYCGCQLLILDKKVHKAIYKELNLGILEQFHPLLIKITLQNQKLNVKFV